MKHDTAVAIFAKLPQPGRVKTRLTQHTLLNGQSVTPEQAAQLYRAFLQDYVYRLARQDMPMDAFFCVPQGTCLTQFQAEISGDLLGVIEEPTRQGRRANNIGEAMSFTIQHFLSAGYGKVMILGSDLPHLPHHLLLEAQSLLDIHPLVLGNDGGGCYLVGASQPPLVLEDPDIVWSQSKDFAMLCSRQERRGETVGVLSEELTDIDELDDLLALCDTLQTEPTLAAEIPATTQILQEWGLFSR